MNVHLTAELRKLVESQVASGLYGSASEVIREALRLLFEQRGLVVRAASPAPGNSVEASRLRTALDLATAGRDLVGNEAVVSKRGDESGLGVPVSQERWNRIVGK